ncbi:alpha/beta hydrolase family protein [Pseudomonas aeruginosa]
MSAPRKSSVKPETLAYGFWPSHWSAERAAVASRDFAELCVGALGLLWIEFCPQTSRCTLWHWRAGQTRCLTPVDFSLRSRVYEYGGGAFCLTDQSVAFVNESDQQIYLQTLDGQPQRLTASADCRFGDLCFDARQQAVLAVEECHMQGQVEHRLVSFSLRDGRRQVIIEGSDFYAAPTLSTDGGRLAWIEWCRPEQPWTATRLCLAERDGQGDWLPAQVVAGNAGTESLQQPRFAAGGQLFCLSDRHGWWQPWAEQDGHWRACQPISQADHAAAPWQLGACSYLPLAGGSLLLSRFTQGWGELVEWHSNGEERPLAAAFSRFRGLAVDAQYFYCIAAAPERLPAILAVCRLDGSVRVLAGGEQALAAGQLSRPQALSFASGGEQAHAFFYKPTNANYRGPEGGKPPLLVFLHGGPTSACYPVFDPRIQFWTQRGFAVADLNYRGSSGFGRAYRQRLQGQWGVIEVEDALALVEHLAARGLIDPARGFIRGASAGGYTTLCALAFHNVFRGGASLYGVSDPLELRHVTHKFEVDYLDWLIGDPLRDAERYRARTPLYHADKITAPLIFFQGGRDAVVMPQQTESMVAALQRRGVSVEYHCYADEGHGFRQAAHLAEVLEREWCFYQRLLG